MAEARTRTPRFAVCVRNEGYEASLERNKIYVVLADADAEGEGDVRVIDESGEDYLYRLTLTTGPYIDHALPLAAANTETTVQFGGWNLGAVNSTILPPLTADADPLTPPDGGLGPTGKGGPLGPSSPPQALSSAKAARAAATRRRVVPRDAMGNAGTESVWPARRER